MFIKPLKLKARNGLLFEFSKTFGNDNYVNLTWNWLDFGIGFRYTIGDVMRYLDINLTFLHLWVWF